MAKIKLQGITQRFDGVAAKDLKVGGLRYFLEQQIIAAEISKAKKEIY